MYLFGLECLDGFQLQDVVKDEQLWVGHDQDYQSLHKLPDLPRQGKRVAPQQLNQQLAAQARRW